MHVVEHHDDLFSWKKKNNYIHMSTLYEYRHKDSWNLAANNLLKITTSLLCWPLNLLCHVSNEQRVLLAHISSIAAGSLLQPFWGVRVGRAWLGLPNPPTLFPGLVPCIPESRQSPDILSGTLPVVYSYCCKPSSHLLPTLFLPMAYLLPTYSLPCTTHV
jgi:hypothetical protein